MSGGRSAFSAARSEAAVSVVVVTRETTWPSAWTPASVRLAPATRIASPTTFWAASTRHPWTVRAFAWICQPWYAPPSYASVRRSVRTTSVGLPPERRPVRRAGRHEDAPDDPHRDQERELEQHFPAEEAPRPPLARLEVGLSREVLRLVVDRVVVVDGEPKDFAQQAYLEARQGESRK